MEEFDELLGMAEYLRDENRRLSQQLAAVEADRDRLQENNRQLQEALERCRDEARGPALREAVMELLGTEEGQSAVRRALGAPDEDQLALQRTAARARALRRDVSPKAHDKAVEHARRLNALNDDDEQRLKAWKSSR